MLLCKWLHHSMTSQSNYQKIFFGFFYQVENDVINPAHVNGHRKFTGPGQEVSHVNGLGRVKLILFTYDAK